MKTNWIIIGIAGLAMSIASGCDAIASFHQGHGSIHGQHSTAPQGGHSNAKAHMDMFAELKLTDAQKTKVGALFTKLHEEMGKLHSDKKSTDAQKKSALIELQKRAGAELNMIFDAEQKRKFAAMGGFQALMAGHMAQMHEALGKLDLTEAQKQQLHAIFTETHQRADVIQKNSALTPEQRAAQMNELHQDAMIRVHGILTPAQMEKLHGMMGHGGGQ